MRLHCEHLEPRTPAVALQWVFDSADPWLAAREETIRAAGDSLASRLTRIDTAAATNTNTATATTTAADAYRIDVQSNPQPRALADAYPIYPPNSLTPHAGVIRFDTSRPWDVQFSLPAVTRHELAHALGVTEHNPSPGSLMYEFAPPVGAVRDVTHSDVPLFERAGWDVRPTTAIPGTIRVWGIGVQDNDTPGPDGWAYVPVNLADTAYPHHVRGPDPLGDSWSLFPPD